MSTFHFRLAAMTVDPCGRAWFPSTHGERVLKAGSVKIALSCADSLLREKHTYFIAVNLYRIYAQILSCRRVSYLPSGNVKGRLMKRTFDAIILDIALGKTRFSVSALVLCGKNDPI
jgi:hypothetical protein